VPAPTLAPSRIKEDLLGRKEKEVWIDKGWVFLRENKAKVVTINVNC